MDDRRLIFIHIPKAAGQTLISIIARQYPPGELAAYTGPVGGAESADYERFAKAKVVVGHIHFGVHEKLPGPSIYVTVLRDPIARVISLYEYIQRAKTHYLNEIVREQDLRSFILSGILDAETENGQTRQIAGLVNGSPTRQTLEGAKNNLAASFAVAGTMERFDQSLLLVKRALGWRWPFYVRKNVTQDLTRSELAGRQQTLSLIRERNELDIELYSFAQTLLNKHIESEGRSFGAEHAMFSLLNKAAGVYKAVRGTKGSEAEQSSSAAPAKDVRS